MGIRSSSCGISHTIFLDQIPFYIGIIDASRNSGLISLYYLWLDMEFLFRVITGVGKSGSVICYGWIETDGREGLNIKLQLVII